ncbi:MAG: shikimate kinase [Dehalococcoidia bacterium]|nr:shikimate kinase [Dehalococcoidia bacterium]
MKSNIALIGFMGAGKSTIARALASKLKKEYIELDSLIEAKAGKPISDIFRDDGEPAFRSLESKTVKRASLNTRAVISCGGGVVLNHSNMEQLKENAVIVYLQADQDVIMQRVKGSEDVRPLLNSADPCTTVAGLLAARHPLYEKFADIIIDTSDLKIEDVVKQIIAGLRERK